MSPLMKRAFQLFVMAALQAGILFACAGSLSWAAGWWYVGLYLGLVLTAALVMIPKYPEVIAARSRGAEGAKPWDLWLTRLLAVPSIGLLMVAGLDERWNLSAPLPPWLRLAGGLLFCAGYFVVAWAMISNPFFAVVVRIEPQRGHRLADGGPYRFVRHPGYVGLILSMFGGVFLLDSLWGLPCFALYLAVLILRTALEDRDLRAELPGYLEFTRRTKYRLLPGVW